MEAYPNNLNMAPVQLVTSDLRYQYDISHSREDNKRNALQFAMANIEEPSSTIARSFATHPSQPIVHNQNDRDNIIRYLNMETNFSHLMHGQYYLHRSLSDVHYYIYIPEDLSYVSWSWITENTIRQAIGYYQNNA